MTSGVDQLALQLPDACPLCAHAREHGWWGQDGTHCGLDPRGPAFDCHRSWTGHTEAHCSECHQHFTSDRVADLHEPYCSFDSTATAQALSIARRNDGTPRFDLRDRKHGPTWVAWRPPGAEHPFAGSA